MENLWKTFWEILVSYKAHLLRNEKELDVKSHSPMSQLHISEDFKEKNVKKLQISNKQISVIHKRNMYQKSVNVLYFLEQLYRLTGENIFINFHLKITE